MTSWSSLSIHFDTSQGRDRHRVLLVPLHRFLAGRLWLSEQCRTYNVGLKLDESVSPILTRVKRERTDLDRLLASSEPLADNAALISSLSRTRYIRELRDFQKRDLNKLLRLRHGANFSVPGGGKTAVAYALYELERIREHVNRLLVIAPLSAFDALGNRGKIVLQTSAKLVTLQRTHSSPS